MGKNDLPQKGAEEARNQLPSLLDAAEKGRTTIITRHGKPVAMLVPYSAAAAGEVKPRPLSILDLEGTGKGLWGPDSTQFVRDIRDEWDDRP